MTLENLTESARRLGPIFYLTVVIPTLAAILYYGIFASDVYISESQFVVRSPEKPAATGLGVLLKSAGFTNASDEVYAANAYIASRDALADLNRKGFIAQAYGKPEISIFDRFNSSGANGSFEALYKYYLKKVTVKQDSASSIITLTVRAYSREDAYAINKQLLERSEALVNSLNARGRTDLIQYALAEVKDAMGESRQAAIALAAFRNREGVVDPDKQAAVQLQMVSKLQDELISTRADLAQLQTFTPQNPQIPALQSRVLEIGAAIDRELGKVAGNRRSLAATAVQYERLTLENQFADKQLAAAMASLQEAQNEARRKQAYVERVSQPNLPDEALEPRRLRGILATFALGLVAWGILKMLFAGVREHAE